MVLLKSRNNSFTILPSIHVIRDNNIKYIEEKKPRIKGGIKRFRKKRPKWVKLSRSQRIATGKGVIRYREMEGTSFNLTIIPIIKERLSITSIR